MSNIREVAMTLLVEPSLFMMMPDDLQFLMTSMKGCSEVQQIARNIGGLAPTDPKKKNTGGIFKFGGGVSGAFIKEHCHLN